MNPVFGSLARRLGRMLLICAAARVVAACGSSAIVRFAPKTRPISRQARGTRVAECEA